MSYPIMDIDGELCMNLQVTSKKKKNSQFAAGFTMFDEIFLHLCGNFLQIKLHQILATIELKVTQRDVVKTIKTAAVVSTQRSYSDFIFRAKNILPDYLGFEDRQSVHDCRYR
jgi:hypothetical protein